MESASSSGAPAPFLVKTYEMVDDSSTDEIVSWSPSTASFIVWNPPEFARLLLPTYFKHNNFSSFIRQLNTYGFHKIDPERWEFSNEEFMKGRKHLLKNIHRRKPIHSHSQPPPDPERLAFEEEIEKLTREKNELDAKVSGFKMQRSDTKSQVEDITKRIGSMEQRQEKLLTNLQKAVQNPGFAELLSQKIEAIIELSAYNKKRRLPQATSLHPSTEDNFVGSQSTCRSEFESIYQQDMSNKLKLELSTAVSNIHLVSNSTQSSSDDWASPPRKSSDEIPKDIEMGITTLPFATETVELLETETCLALQSLQQNLVPRLECEGHVSCELDLSLASAQMLANEDRHSDKATHMEVEPNPDNNGNLTSSQEARNNNKLAPPTPAAPARVNDQFWEQFLGGSSDAEEACSSYRAPPCDDQEETGSSHGMTRTAKNLAMSGYLGRTCEMYTMGILCSRRIY